MGRRGGDGPGRKREEVEEEEGGSPAAKRDEETLYERKESRVKRCARGAELMCFRVDVESVREGIESKMHFTTRPQRRHILNEW